MSSSSKVSEIEHISNPEKPAEVGVFIFAGHGVIENIGCIPRFEFVKTMKNHFPSLDVHFYVDYNRCWYAKGFEGITKNIDESVDYLKSKLHKKNIFMGNSAGGYASVLFGSILNVDRVVAFHLQSNLHAIPSEIEKHKHVDRKYMTLDPYINDTTDYRLYGQINGGNQIHHSSQLDYLMDLKKPNMSRTLMTNQLKDVRNKGKLVPILQENFKL